MDNDITLLPPPDANDHFTPGQTVNVCYEINQYEKPGCNWLHGIVPTFGPCWDPASFNASGMPINITTALVTAGDPAAPFPTSGSWGWFPNGAVLENITSAPVGAGWFFLTSYQAHGGDPDQSYGDGWANGGLQCDPAGNGFTWEVCFDLIVADTGTCTNLLDCGVTFTTYADGQTGVWTDPGCAADVPSSGPPASLCCIKLITFPDSIICIGDQVQLGNFLDPSYTLGTYTWYGGVPNISPPLVSTLVSPLASTTYYTVYDHLGCKDTTSIEIIVNTLPVADAGLDSTVCAGDPYNLGGIGNTSNGYNFVWAGGTGSGLVTGGLVTAIATPLTDSTFFLTVSDSSGVCPDSTDQITLTMHDAPDTINVTIVCNGTNTFYEVIFDIVGGDSGSYAVTGDPGTLVGITFTSNLIANGAPYIFNVDDIYGCGPLVLDSSYYCGCTTESGTMNLAPLSACVGDSLTGIFNNDSTLDLDDVLSYIIHSNATPSAGIVYGSSTNPTFGLMGGMIAGTTYYISVVAGNDLGSGIANPADPCYDVSAGVPVRFHALPTANISGSTNICIGDSTPLTFTLTGTGPFTVSYTDGTDTTMLVGIASGYQSYVTPSVATTYTLVAITDNNAPICTGTVLTGSATINIRQRPVANAGNDVLICAGSAANLGGPGNLQNGYLYSWTCGAGFGVVFGGSAPGLFVPGASTTCTLTISDPLAVCPDSSDQVAVTVIPAPVADAGTNGSICPGDSMIIGGVANVANLYNYSWNNGAGSGTVSGSTVDDYVGPAITTVYTLTVTDTAGLCAASNDNVTVSVSAPPSVVISGGGAVCAGNPAPNIVFTFTGTAPWNLTYFDGGVQNVNPVAASPYSIVNPAIGTYYPTAVSDAGCAGTVSDTATVANFPLPTATISGGGSVCAPLPAPPIQVNFTGTGPFNFQYRRTPGGNTTVNAASNPYFINNPGAGTYTVNWVTDANCTNNSGIGSAIVNISTAPTYTVSGGGASCTGAPTLPVSFSFTGSPPWNFTYNVNGAQVHVPVSFSNPFVINNPAYGTYRLDSISDGGCYGIPNGQFAIVSKRPAPTGQISGGGTTCAGQCLPINFTLSGTPPFNISYCINGVAQNPILGVNANSHQIACPTEGSYTFCGLSDAFCPADPGGLTGTAVMVINDLPNITVTGGGEICQGEPVPQITMELQGTTPWDIWYSVDGVPQNALQNINTTPYIINPIDGAYLVTSLHDLNCYGTIINGSARLVIHPAATSPPLAGVNQTYCQGVPMADMSASASFGGEIHWFTDVDLTSEVGKGNRMTPLPFIGKTTYYASEVIDLCNGPASTVTINVLSKPLLDAGDDATIYAGEEWQMNATVSGGNPPYSLPTWSPPFSLTNAAVLDPVAKPLETTEYIVSIADVHCASTDTIKLMVLQELIVPTGITPDGDGYNDTWVISNIEDYPQAVVTVFNRWGGRIFVSDPGYPESWNGTFNGKPVPVGSHFFTIELNDDKTPPITGSVTIIN